MYVNSRGLEVRKQHNWLGRRLHFSGSSFSRFKSRTAWMYVGFLSTLITRGAATCFPPSTFLKNRFAARLLLEALRRKSSVFPAESRAR
jgi:hypothetical protein